MGYGFAHRHLLGIEPLQPGGRLLLDQAAAFADLAPEKRPTGSRVTVINLFYENSTRTRSSFEIAAQLPARTW